MGEKNPGWKRARAALLAVLVAVAGCREVEDLREAIRLTPSIPHEAYAESLREAGLEGTALGQAWTAASRRALWDALPVDAPFREAVYFPGDEAAAVGYRVELRQGQLLRVRADAESAGAGRLFVDLFRPAADSATPPEHLASADSGAAALEWEARRDGEVLLRLQPELLRGGRYAVTIERGASLAFPVAERDSRAIRSRFGAERDGGRREHHGVDIFAPRGTPVLASAEGIVSGARETPRGGKVVWLRDWDRGQSLYYAHLDSQLVQTGARVQPGDTLGLVGNTGNARTTPPHLHFGIYRSGFGPVDPYPFVHQPRARPEEVAADTGALGEWRRATEAELRLRASPDGDAELLRELPRHTALRVLGGSGSWYRARLPDGATGWVAARLTEPLDRPIREERIGDGGVVRDRPSMTAAVIDRLPTDARVPVLGRFEEFLYVQAPGERAGWVRAE